VFSAKCLLLFLGCGMASEASLLRATSGAGSYGLASGSGSPDAAEDGLLGGGDDDVKPPRGLGRGASAAHATRGTGRGRSDIVMGCTASAVVLALLAVLFAPLVFFRDGGSAQQVEDGHGDSPPQVQRDPDADHPNAEKLRAAMNYPVAWLGYPSECDLIFPSDALEQKAGLTVQSGRGGKGGAH